MRSAPLQTVVLRPMIEADLKTVLGWRNHISIRACMYSQHEISLQEHTSWFKQAQGDPGYILLILVVDGLLQGYVNFRRKGTDGAVWGFYSAPDAPKGTGILLGEKAISHAFTDLKLEKIWGEVFVTNIVSRTYHTRMGFHQESEHLEVNTPLRPSKKVLRSLLTREDWEVRQGEIE